MSSLLNKHPSLAGTGPLSGSSAKVRAPLNTNLQSFLTPHPPDDDDTTQDAHQRPLPVHHDGRGLRIGIIHARWNDKIIEPLLAGTKAKLLECGVQESNIVVQSVPGSWELPLAVQRLYSASQVQSSSSGATAAGDLLGSSTADLSASTPTSSGAASTGPFDALIAIGVLIKGETMHFEYISESVSQGLMRVSLDTGIPVIFGVLTVLTDDQAKARAGLIAGSHNHGEDWGLAAVEMAVKRKSWAAGEIA